MDYRSGIKKVTIDICPSYEQIGEIISVASEWHVQLEPTTPIEASVSNEGMTCFDLMHCRTCRGRVVQ